MAENPEQASPDLLRTTVQAFARALMGADADAICAGPCTGRARGLDELHQGGYFPDWLLERRRRVERR